jgi:DNA polymerase III delta subunit
VAISPEEVFTNAEEKLKQAKKTLPELITMAESEKVKVQTLFYEGLRGIEDALQFNMKEMKGKEILGFFATGEDASKDLLDVFSPYAQDMQKAGIQVRGITPEHESTKDILDSNRKHGLIIKTIPTSMYSSKVSIEAGENFVRIILMKPQQALIIKNPELAKCMKEIFEIVYSSK